MYRIQFNTYLPVDATTHTIAVNPLPSNVLITSPTTSVCSEVAFDITATASGAVRIELWDSPKTGKISDLPYEATLTSDTQFVLVAVSSAGCVTEIISDIVIDNEVPVAICKTY